MKIGLNCEWIEMKIFIVLKNNGFYSTNKSTNFFLDMDSELFYK